MVLVAFWNDQIFSGAIPQACEKDGSGCHSFKLFANLGKDTGVDQAWINAWNNSYYYVRAFKLQDGQLIFEWNVALLTGVTPDYIKLAAIAVQVCRRQVDRFQAAMKAFEPFPSGERKTKLLHQRGPPRLRKKLSRLRFFLTRRRAPRDRRLSITNRHSASSLPIIAASRCIPNET